MRRALIVLSLGFALPACSFASTISVSGFITQSTSDGTGPAISNLSLNNLTDSQLYTLSFDTSTTLIGPGVYDLTSLSFAAPEAPASESNFAASSLTVTADGSSFDFSIFACLTNADCFSGNQLTANFSVPALTGLTLSATGLDEPHPLDLLEDDGLTDIQASISTYSNAAPVVTPEPSTGSLVALSLIVGAMTLLFAKRTATQRSL